MANVETKQVRKPIFRTQFQVTMGRDNLIKISDPDSPQWVEPLRVNWPGRVVVQTRLTDDGDWVDYACYAGIPATHAQSALRGIKDGSLDAANLVL